MKMNLSFDLILISSEGPTECEEKYLMQFAIVREKSYCTTDQSS